MQLNVEQYHYELPSHFIAKYPLPIRDQSKLLVYEDGAITHRNFYELPQLLQANDILVFNNSRVIQARFYFYKITGARIEVFLHDPVEPSTLVEVAMQQTQEVIWSCLVGNKKKWHIDEIFQLQGQWQDKPVNLKAQWANVEQNQVKFSWEPAHLSFAEIVQVFGHLPLPPYLHREAEASDLHTYQTVYATKDGAVAAPTAGLHFTETVMKDLKNKGVQLEYLTLHVGAGTFKPVTTKNIAEHTIHREEIHYTKDFIQALAETGADNRIVAVGTTSMRALETLYYVGLKGLDASGMFELAQYEDHKLLKTHPNIPYRQALKQLLSQMEAANLGSIAGHSALYILPGYNFQICQGLITNFHLPGSTLLALVDAFIGEAWKKVYAEALDHNYRFLSFGDSSLLWRNSSVASASHNQQYDEQGQ